MNLIIDIGNSQTVLGIFNNDNLVRRWRISTSKTATSDEFLASLIQFITITQIQTQSLKNVIFASVVPEADHNWKTALSELLGKDPLKLDSQTCGLKLEYTSPLQIGADRLANVLGALRLGASEGIIVDFGTATTFDVFSPGTYCGGVICPGIGTSLEGLSKKASKLHSVEMHWPGNYVGNNTGDAIRTGMLWGTVGMTMHMVDAIVKEKQMQNPQVFLTGGWAALLAQKLPQNFRLETDLTLRGLNYLLEKEQG